MNCSKCGRSIPEPPPPPPGVIRDTPLFYEPPVCDVCKKKANKGKSIRLATHPTLGVMPMSASDIRDAYTQEEQSILRKFIDQVSYVRDLGIENYPRFKNLLARYGEVSQVVKPVFGVFGSIMVGKDLTNKLISEGLNPNHASAVGIVATTLTMAPVTGAALGAYGVTSGTWNVGLTAGLWIRNNIDKYLVAKDDIQARQFMDSNVQWANKYKLPDTTDVFFETFKAISNNI